MKSDAPPVSDRTILYLAFILFLVEFLLFKTTFAVNYQPYYARAYDQTVFIRSAYATYYSINDYGFINTIQNIGVLQPQLFKGPIVPNLAVVFAFLFGADRLNIISVNFLFFMVGQIALFYFFTKKVNAYAGVTAVGLFFLSMTHYYWIGGITDFRLDYAGMATFGVAFLAYSCLMDKPTLANFIFACIATTATLATRSITGIYAFLLVIFLNATFLLNLKFKFFRKDADNQFKYFAYLLIVLVVVFGGAFILAGRGSINYYGGMFHGPDRSIRAAQFGATTALEILLYYPKSAFFHFWYYGYVAIAIIAFQGLKQIFLGSLRVSKGDAARDIDWRERLFLFFATAFSVWIPLLIYSQSGIVIGVLTIPVVFILTLAISKQIERTPKEIKIFISGAIFLAGFLFYAGNMASPFFLPPRPFVEAKKINALYRDMQDMLISRNVPLNLSWMINHEAFIPYAFEVYLYEHDGRAETSLVVSKGPGIAPIAEDDIIKRIKESDLIVAPLRFYPATSFEYPFTRSLRQYENSWRKNLETDFILKKEYEFKPYWAVGLYVKPCLIKFLDAPNSIEYDGATPFFWLGNKQAAIHIENNSQNSLNANLQAVGEGDLVAHNVEKTTLRSEINGAVSTLLATKANHWRLSIPMVLQPGDNVLFVSDVDKTDAQINSNGDARQLLSRISNISVSCQSQAK